MADALRRTTSGRSTSKNRAKRRLAFCARRKRAAGAESGTTVANRSTYPQTKVCAVHSGAEEYDLEAGARLQRLVDHGCDSMHPDPVACAPSAIPGDDVPPCGAIHTVYPHPRTSVDQGRLALRSRCQSECKLVIDVTQPSAHAARDR